MSLYGNILHTKVWTASYRYGNTTIYKQYNARDYTRFETKKDRLPVTNALFDMVIEKIVMEEDFIEEIDYIKIGVPTSHR